MYRALLIAGLFTGAGALFVIADTPPRPKTEAEGKSNEVELVESVLKTRKDYLASLDKLRVHYRDTNDLEKIKWVEEEMRSFHRMMKYSYRLDVKDVPPPTLQPKQNIPEANNLFRRAMEYKNKGFGEEYVDNQRRAELYLQGILERYPESDKIGEVAYHLGDIYENYKPRPQYPRAAAYFERSFQWSKSASTDARLRAAKIYDRHLKIYDKAKELYKSVMNNDSNPERVQEAERRLNELSGSR
jgi:hypothetical protein